MKRIYKSGAQKRKEAASSRQSAAKLTKLTRFFWLHKQIGQVKTPLLRMQPNNNIRNLFYQPQQSRKISTSLSKSVSLGSSLTANMERKTKVQEVLVLHQKHQDLFPQPSFNPFLNNPACWPDLYQMYSDVTLSKEGLNEMT